MASCSRKDATSSVQKKKCLSTNSLLTEQNKKNPESQDSMWREQSRFLNNFRAPFCKDTAQQSFVWSVRQTPRFFTRSWRRELDERITSTHLSAFWGRILETSPSWAWSALRTSNVQSPAQKHYTDSQLVSLTDRQLVTALQTVTVLQKDSQ